MVELITEIPAGSQLLKPGTQGRLKPILSKPGTQRYRFRPEDRTLPMAIVLPEQVRKVHQPPARSGSVGDVVSPLVFEDAPPWADDSEQYRREEVQREEARPFLVSPLVPGGLVIAKPKEGRHKLFMGTANLFWFLIVVATVWGVLKCL